MPCSCHAPDSMLVTCVGPQVTLLGKVIAPGAGAATTLVVTHIQNTERL